MIRRQERDWFCYQNRIERETRKSLQDQLEADLHRENNEHGIRVKLLKEMREAAEKDIQVARKEERVRATQERRELKAAKKQ